MLFLAIGGLPHPRGGAPWLLWTSVLHTPGSPFVGPVSRRGGLRPSLRHVLLHGQLGGLYWLFATRTWLESWPPLCLPGRPGWVPLFPPHPHLRLQCTHHHEGVWRTLVCQQWLGRVRIVTGDGGWHDRDWPVWRAALMLLPAEV